MKKTGIYIHVPFCKGKCPYCDFFSLNCRQNEKDKYLDALKRELSSFDNVYANTIYVGGGTPSVLSGKEIYDIVNDVKTQFHFSQGEITVEANPSSLTEDFAKEALNSGVNRFSLGLQSAVSEERKLLGRTSSPKDISEKITMLRSLGANNISLDVMLGIPSQTVNSLKTTLDFCIAQDVEHISAYILKIEEGTFFQKHIERYDFPDEDLSAQMYEFACEYLEDNGFSQYEISNFSKPGFESRHNLKYWNCEEYLGFGPSAHSFFNKKRFFHDRDFNGYINDPISTENDGYGGDFKEYSMLKLRLSKGLLESEVVQDFGFCIPESLRKKSKVFEKNNLLISDENGIRLTRRGFLVSNYIIARLID